MATSHIESRIEDIAKKVLMPGDPLRARYIAENFLEDVKIVNNVRNMTAYTGYYKGEKVTVFPSGMGVPSIGIYAYELYKFYDVEEIIRIGTSGSFNENIKLLDVVLSKSAYCKSYFPNLFFGENVNEVDSDTSLNEKIVKTAQDKNIPLKVGKTITSDVFDVYIDNREEFRNNFPDNDFLAAEMEAFGLFYLAKKLNKKAACLMTVVDSLYDSRSISSKERETSLNDMIEIALNAVLL